MSTPGLVHLVHALSPVHMGIGTSTGGIDLPLAREVSTGWPMVPGSGLKGVLRSAMGASADDLRWLFGGDWNNTLDRDQGALMFSDLRLLCLPVRSYAGGWAWVTSPGALAAYLGEARWCNAAPPAWPDIPAAPKDSDCVCATPAGPLAVGGHVYVHDLALKAGGPTAGSAMPGWADHLATRLFAQDARAATCFKDRVILVSEAALAYLGTVAMDVRTRVRLEDDKVVADSGPWVEENLPVETILWGSVAADTIEKAVGGGRSPEEAITAYAELVGAERRLQLGGKATVGRGVVRFMTAGA